MRLGLVTDSTCDLPASSVEQLGILVVPAILIMDGREYLDGAGIGRQQFYGELPRLKHPPTTAAPSAGEFRTCYENLLSSGCDHVLSIHAAEALTAICAAARLAAADFGGRVTVVDSRSLSLGLGFQLLAAAEAAENGLAAALEAQRSTLQRLRLWAALDTLTYARRSGRIPSILAAFGALLHLKPVVELIDGRVVPAAATRTTSQSIDRLLSLLRSCGALERLAVLHTGAESRARDLLAQLMRVGSLMLPRDILLVNVTPVIGAHVGPNAVGIAAVRASI